MDGDGVGNNTDAFPNDSAASIDTDGDGYPEEWNTGKTGDDSTTGLKLDKYPDNPNKWGKKEDGKVYFYLIIGVISVVIIVVIKMKMPSIQHGKPEAPKAEKEIQTSSSQMIQSQSILQQIESLKPPEQQQTNSPQQPNPEEHKTNSPQQPNPEEQPIQQPQISQPDQPPIQQSQSSKPEKESTHSPQQPPPDQQLPIPQQQSIQAQPDNWTCSKCGKVLDVKNVYCTNCGSKKDQ